MVRQALLDRRDLMAIPDPLDPLALRVRPDLLFLALRDRLARLALLGRKVFMVQSVSLALPGTKGHLGPLVLRDLPVSQVRQVVPAYKDRWANKGHLGLLVQPSR